MRRFLLPIFCLLAVSACESSGGFDAGSRASHTILIMAEDSDFDSVSRNSRTSRRVLNEVSSQISAYGFSVFDEAALTLNTHRQGRARRSEAELIDTARAMKRPPIDTVALFTIFTENQNLPHTTKVRVRLAGRLVDVQSGRRLGNFDVSDNGNVNPDCSGPCYAETVSDIARTLGREVADVLAQKLDVRFTRKPGPRERTGHVRGMSLVFDNFSAVEMQDIEGYLEIFSGYQSHRPTASFHRRAEIWYESSIPHAKFRRNLDRMFDELGMKARVSFQGNAYTIRQVRVPSRARRQAPKYKW